MGLDDSADVMEKREWSQTPLLISWSASQLLILLTSLSVVLLLVPLLVCAPFLSFLSLFLWGPFFFLSNGRSW